MIGRRPCGGVMKWDFQKNTGTIGPGYCLSSQNHERHHRGTGRFQGIKGTLTNTTKLLPPEKGEPAPKALTENVSLYTLPGK
jgi:hypothetical protein